METTKILPRELLLPSTCYGVLKPELQIKGAVIHYISAINTSLDAPFNVEECIKILKEYKFSYHFLIDRMGHIWQLVPLQYQAYHAGKSKFLGIEHWNRVSVGICLIGGDPNDSRIKGDDKLFTTEQYVGTSAVLRRLKKDNPLFSMNMVVGHEQVAGYRGKKDPGPNFDWVLTKSMVTGTAESAILLGSLA